MICPHDRFLNSMSQKSIQLEGNQQATAELRPSRLRQIPLRQG
jgi:hypothetical protein